MKKKIRLVIIAIILPIIGIAEPEGDVIFSVSMVKGAFTGDHSEKTGIFFYHYDQGPKYASPSVSGYHFRDGKIIDVFGGGTSGSSRFLEKLKQINISSFDCEQKVKDIIARQDEKAKALGKKFRIPTVVDGAKYQIFYSYNGETVSYTEWNPGPTIDYLSEYDEDILQFRNVIDLFASYYGRRKFGL